MKIRLLLLAAASAYCTMATAQQPRLVAASRWLLDVNQQYMPYDSVNYVHSGMRRTVPALSQSSYADDGVNMYDTAMVYQYFPGTGQWRNSNRMLRNYHANDSVYQFDNDQWDAGTAAWEKHQRFLWSYDALWAVDTYTIQQYDIGSSSFVNSIEASYTYQGGKLATKLIRQWLTAGSQWQDLTVDSFFYDQNGGDSLHIYGSWDWMQGGLYKQLSRHHYVTDAGGRRMVDTFYFNNVYSRRTHYQYDANGRLLRDSFYQWVSFPPAFEYKGKTEYIYDAGGNLVRKELLNWNKNQAKYDENLRYHYEYNNHGLLWLAHADQHDGTNFTKHSYDKYFFYDSSLSVAEVGAPAQFELYPVPALTHVNMELEWETARSFAVRICDMQGRVVRGWNEPAQKAYRKRIELAGLPAGQYILQVSDGDRRLARSFSILQ